MEQKAADSVEVWEKHPLLIRITHWINFPILVIMLWSGVAIYWANRAYWPNFPSSWYTYLGFSGRLAEGLSYHLTFMWLFALNGLIYFFYMIFSGKWREITPQRKSFREAFQ